MGGPTPPVSICCTQNRAQIHTEMPSSTWKGEEKKGEENNVEVEG